MGVSGASTVPTASANMAAESALSTDGRGFLLGFTAPVGPGLLIFSGMPKEDPRNFSQDANKLCVATCVRCRGASACTRPTRASTIITAQATKKALSTSILSWNRREKYC